MARGRLISKSLGSSRRFHALIDAGGPLGEFCQSLFVLIVANTDDFGRMAGDAFTVKHAVLPTSSRQECDFDVALDAMMTVGLVDRYQVDGRICLQVLQFDAHQINLHKRTASVFPESPGISGKFQSNIRESNLRESKRIQGNVRIVSSQEMPILKSTTTARSNRPIFDGQRITIFEWMLDELMKVLGSHTNDFDLHEWFFALDQKAMAMPVVIARTEQWPWIQAELLAEAEKRGLPIATVKKPGKPTAGDKVKAMIAAIDQMEGKQ